jgi:hypothetical protein
MPVGIYNLQIDEIPVKIEASFVNRPFMLRGSRTKPFPGRVFHLQFSPNGQDSCYYEAFYRWDDQNGEICDMAQFIAQCVTVFKSDPVQKLFQ